MAAALRKAGVEVHSGFLLAHFNDGQGASGGDEVFSAAFTSNTKPIRLECKAVFSFYKQMVDYDAFKGWPLPRLLLCFIVIKAMYECLQF